MKHIQPFVDLSGITTICEPFCGSCSFSLKQKEIKKFILNDIDNELIFFLSEVKKGKFKDYVKYFNETRPKYEVEGKPTKEWYSIKNAKNKTSTEWFLFRRATRGGSLMDLRLQHLDMSEYDHLVDFFKSDDVELSSTDYLDVFEKVKNDKNIFVFLDPPYLDSFNASYESFHGGSTTSKNVINDRTKMFIDIRKFLKHAKCRVMLIINKNSITDYIFKKYIKGEYAKRYDMTGRCTIHSIVTNY